MEEEVFLGNNEPIGIFNGQVHGGVADNEIDRLKRIVLFYRALINLFLHVPQNQQGHDWGENVLLFLTDDGALANLHALNIANDIPWQNIIGVLDHRNANMIIGNNKIFDATELLEKILDGIEGWLRLHPDELPLPIQEVVHIVHAENRWPLFGLNRSQIIKIVVLLSVLFAILLILMAKYLWRKKWKLLWDWVISEVKDGLRKMGEFLCDHRFLSVPFRLMPTNPPQLRRPRVNLAPRIIPVFPRLASILNGMNAIRQGFSRFL